MAPADIPQEDLDKIYAMKETGSSVRQIAKAFDGKYSQTKIHNAIVLKFGKTRKSPAETIKDIGKKMEKVAGSNNMDESHEGEEDAPGTPPSIRSNAPNLTPTEQTLDRLEQLWHVGPNTLMWFGYMAQEMGCETIGDLLEKYALPWIKWAHEKKRAWGKNVTPRTLEANMAEWSRKIDAYDRIIAENKKLEENGGKEERPASQSSPS